MSTIQSVGLATDLDTSSLIRTCTSKAAVFPVFQTTHIDGISATYNFFSLPCLLTAYANISSFQRLKGYISIGESLKDFEFLISSIL